VLVFLTRFLYGEVTSPQPAWAPKARFGGKTFGFTRKPIWNITEPPGTFFTKNYKGNEVNPSALGRVHFSGKIGPTNQPYYCRTQETPGAPADTRGGQEGHQRDRRANGGLRDPGRTGGYNGGGSERAARPGGGGSYFRG
jgi:hypothetical protein